MKTTGSKRRDARKTDAKPDSVASSPSVRANESSVVRSDDVKTRRGSAKDMNEMGNNNSDQVRMLKIIIKRVGISTEDACLELLVSQESSVLDLKRRIAEELAVRKNDDYVPVERQRLIFSGRLLIDDDSLVDGVKMMVDSPNCVHLAPIPDGLGPSNHRNNDNADESVARRPSLSRGRGARASRELRRSQESPYGSIESLLERRRSEVSRHGSEHARRVLEHESASRAALPQLFYNQVSAARQEASLTSDYAFHSMICQEPMLLAAIPAVIPVSQLVVSPLRLDAISLGIDQGLGDDLGRDIWRRINELLPLCRVMPEQLIRSLTTAGSDSDHLSELRYQTELEQTASVLDQVVQRGAELSNSLRHFVYARRAAAQSSWIIQGTSNQYDTGSYQDPYARF